MSEFEIKYLKEVLTNLKIIRNDLEYKYKIDEIIEMLSEFIRVLIKRTKDGIYTDKGFVPFCDIKYIDIIGEVKE